MKVEVHANSLPIKMWFDDVEPSAMQQARNLAALPFAFKHIALMPDCHTGYGMPIGGVLAAEGVVVPNAVGVDIGCGTMRTREKSFRGTIGRGYSCDNAVTFRFGNAINGSGGSAFGAKRWPYLRVEVQAEVGDEARLTRVADMIEAILESEGLLRRH